MKILTWSEELSVRDSELDSHHKNIVDAINRLESALRTKEEQNVTEKIIEELFKYVEDHFSAEETLFRKVNFPHAELHIAQHKKFREQLELLQLKFERKDQFASLEILDFLIEWLTNHISTFDREYIPYISELS